MLKNFSRLEKLSILVYSSSSRRGRPKNKFEAMFNPESYSLAYENVYQEEQGLNTSGCPARYSVSKPENLSITLILDDTGVTNTYAKADGKQIKNLDRAVETFLELTTEMDGEIHRPYYLTLQWGTLNFNCCLKSLDINYTLFHPSGRPLRAELETLFIEDKEDEGRVREENKSSPDLTHSRTVMGGDKLPLMAKEIYQDTAYYIELARANKLNNFRKLRTGNAINFPPVKN